MPPLAPTTGYHLNLTVSDLDRSVEWYCRTFGLTPLADERMAPPVTGDPLRYRSLGSLETMSYVIGLMEHEGGTGERFDERRTGLDHFGFHVPEVADLEAWRAHLDDLGVEHSGIQAADYASSISLRDPDNIQLELAVPNLEFWMPIFLAAAGPDS